MTRLIAITLTVVLVLTLCSGLAFAKGPAEKATGTVGGPPRGWYADFNAHEAKENQPAKGSMHMWSDEVGRELDLQVKYVSVEGDTTWFAALCTYDSWVGHSHYRVGKWFFVKVHDGGTPGRKGDHIGWDWNSGTNEADVVTRVSNMVSPANWWSVTDGNLVVHN